MFAAFAETKTAEELVELIHSCHVPCGEAKDVAELLHDPHLRARGMVVDIDHPRLGHIQTYNNPIMFDRRSIGIQPGENPQAPEIGESNETVLRELLSFHRNRSRRCTSPGRCGTERRREPWEKAVFRKN